MIFLLKFKINVFIIYFSKYYDKIINLNFVIFILKKMVNKKMIIFHFFYNYLFIMFDESNN